VTMRYGVVLPGGTAGQQVVQAVDAERAGWDAVFVWEAAYGVDAWSLLAAMAVATERVRLGTMITPLPWRRPWKVAGQVATVDQLSGGRAILGIGLGATDPALPQTGEVTDLRTRAAMMDEGIDLMRTLWAGGSSYHGEHYDYQASGPSDDARPVQPSVPIWVIGRWPRPKSMRRVLRCDGVIPENAGTPQEIGDLIAWLGDNGARPGLDVLTEGSSPAHDPAAARAQVEPWARAGCTWWLESFWELPGDSATKHRKVSERIAAGPPRISGQ
jgi:hypothetical protein